MNLRAEEPDHEPRTPRSRGAAPGGGRPPGTGSFFDFRPSLYRHSSPVERHHSSPFSSQAAVVAPVIMAPKPGAVPPVSERFRSPQGRVGATRRLPVGGSPLTP